MIAAVALVALALPAATMSQEPQIPPPAGVVNDFAHVLDAATFERITRIAEDVRAKSRGEMAVVTLPDLKGREVADVALRIGREWKVGKIGSPGDPTRNAGASAPSTRVTKVCVPFRLIARMGTASTSFASATRISTLAVISGFSICLLSLVTSIFTSKVTTLERFVP